MTRPDFIRSRLSVAEVNELKERADAAESALSAAQKRIEELEGALRVVEALGGDVPMVVRAALAGKEDGQPAAKELGNG